MKEKNEYTTIGLKALLRAAQKAYIEAKKNSCKIPIWENGRIEFIPPERIDEQEIMRKKD
jgi:hypothetical protein